MKYLKNELFLPFNIKDKNGRYVDINSYDWDKLIFFQKNCGLYGVNGKIYESFMLSTSHEIYNIKVLSSGLYGDVKILNNPYGLKLNDVFRPRIEVDIDVKYQKIYNIDMFFAISKTNDIYGDIIYRREKLQKIVKKCKKEKNY